MAKFKVGDRVKCVCVVDDNKHVVGKIGTIIKTCDTRYGVEFDKNIHGHQVGDIKCKFNHCW